MEDSDKFQKMRKTAVIFDMDGTMFDTEELFYESQEQVCKEMGIPFSREYYIKFIGMSEAKYLELFAEDIKSTDKIFQMIEKADKLFYELIETRGVPLKSGLIELLQHLKKKNIVCVIASSSKRSYIETLIKKAGIAEYFSGIVAGDEVKNAKPDPEIFEKALGITKRPREEALVLEDSVNGVAAGFAAKIDTIQIPDMRPPTDTTKMQSKAIVKSLADVIPMLE